jgi:hypothetical protein
MDVSSAQLFLGVGWVGLWFNGWVGLVEQARSRVLPTPCATWERVEQGKRDSEQEEEQLSGRPEEIEMWAFSGERVSCGSSISLRCG